MGGPEFVYCDLATLPDDAQPGPQGNGKYTFGSDVFGGSADWIVCENGTDPVKVWRLPPPVTRICQFLMDKRYEDGRQAIKAELRETLGLDE